MSFVCCESSKHCHRLDHFTRTPFTFFVAKKIRKLEITFICAHTYLQRATHWFEYVLPSYPQTG